MKSEKFALSPMKRRSVLPDDTEIEAPRRASWWKRLEGSSRDVLEALDTNKMTDDLLLEEYEYEVDKNDKQSQSVQQSQSSDNESVASIVVPQRRLFNKKKQTQGNFGDIMGSRKSLGKTNIEDQSIEDAPKNLFNKGPSNKPVFPAALLNSTNKTINKTVEPETNKQTRPNLFGQAGGKRKNMFTDFVLSDSEEDSEVQHKVFGFKKNNNKRISLGTRNRRMPSLTPSMTTEIDIDDWNLLPSSTMIGTQENSRMSDKDMELMQDENQDDTLTENNASSNRTKQTRKSMIENDKTLTNENIEDGNKGQTVPMETDEPIKVNKTHDKNTTKLNVSGKDKINKSMKQASNLTNTDDVEIDAVVVRQEQNIANEHGLIAENMYSLEDKMAELHGESVSKEESRQKFTSYKIQEKLCEDTMPTNRANDGEFMQEQSAKVPSISNISKTTNITRENEILYQKRPTQELEKSVGTIARDGSDELISPSQDKDAENIFIQENNNQKEIDTAGSIVTSEDKASDQEGVGEFEKENTKEVEISARDKGQDKSEKDIESEEDIHRERSVENQNQTKDTSKSNHDVNMYESPADQEVSQIEKEQSAEEKELSKNEQEENVEQQEQSEEEKDQSEEEQEQSEDEQEQSEEEQEQSEEEQEQSEEEQEQSEEEQEQSVNMDESEAEHGVSEKEIGQSFEEHQQSVEEQEQSREQPEPSLEEQRQNLSEKRSHDQDMDRKDEEVDQEDREEAMEKMIWNDNDDDTATDAPGKEMDAAQSIKVRLNKENNETSHNTSKVPKNSNKSKNITNRSQKIVDASVNKDEMEGENDVVDETPHNSMQDTTGRNRNKEIKSPEAVMQNMTNDNESFRPIGRSTTFRKSKSVYETMHMRHSLAPVQESTLGSEGSRNSSTEGSEWDSHRTTRKTIRQTLGKEYTTRKSLRALVMEQSAKRQTELYNKTTNKTITNEKNASKLNKTKNKTVNDVHNKNTSAINKTKNKTMIEDANSKHASKINETKNKIVLEDIDDQHIRFRRTSNRNSSNLSPNLNSLVHGTSTHHVPDPLISECHASYHESLHDIQEPGIVEQNLSNPEDSGPEISMNASYGQGMTASGDGNLETSDVEMLEKRNTSPEFHKQMSRRATSVRSKSINSSEQEDLDYEASEQVSSGIEGQESSNHYEAMNEENESENEEEICVESEKEEEEDAHQETELESEHEETHCEIEEDESHEIEEQEPSQQDIESEQESQENEQGPDSEEEQSENDSGHNASQESVNGQESEHDVSTEPENETSDQEDFISAINSKYKTPERRGVSRIVLDSNMMSVEEIDFEGDSRQTDNDMIETIEREPENDTEYSEMESRASMKRVSEPIHDVSIGTKKSQLLMQLQKIADQNQERRQKIRDQVQKSLKPSRNFAIQDIGLKLPKYSIRRPQEPRKPKSKLKPTGIVTETLPTAFMEDLIYKPPKRFQPANAPWITKRLYKFLETKLEPKYDYRARVRAEELVQSLFSFSKLVRKRDLAPPQAVDDLKREMARLRIVNTHYEFYDFFHEFMPREIRIKVNPDVVNKIPMPRNGVFSEILQSRAVVE